MGFYYVIGTVLFTVYGQLIIKWRINTVPVLPTDTHEKISFLVKLLFDPWIFSGLLSAIIASLFWMAAMTKFDISYAYPFMSSAFILVFILSVILFQEPITWQKILGLLLIVAGIIITSRSA